MKNYTEALPVGQGLQQTVEKVYAAGFVEGAMCSMEAQCHCLQEAAKQAEKIGLHESAAVLNAIRNEMLETIPNLRTEVEEKVVPRMMKGARFDNILLAHKGKMQ